MASRSNPQTKYFNKSPYKPDTGVSSALNSIKQNPKFSRLLAFSINCLNPLITPPNPRHRENANFFISQEGLDFIIKAIIDHSKDDEILFNSTTLLIRLIGKGKFKDEKIASLILNKGGVSAVMNALNIVSEKNKHTFKLFIEFLEINGNNSKISLQLIDQNVLETILTVISKVIMSPQNICKAIDTLCIILSYPECKAALLNRDLLPTIQTILSKKSFSPLIVTSILKLLELLSRSSEGIKYMKKNNSLEAIVSSMEKHPYEKELLSNGSTILSKIVTMSDLNNILTILKNNDKNNSSLINISIFSQLALIDDMMDEILRQGALIDLIKIMELNLDENINESPDKIILIKNCCIALGRIIEVDLKQFLGVVDLGALNLLKSLLIEVKNPEIIEVGLHTLNKLAKNTEIFALIEKEDFLGLVLKNIFYWKNENCCEALLIFLILQAEKGSSEILAQNGLEIIIKIMETHMIQKKVVEKGVKLFSILIKDEIQVEKLIELKGIELLYKINKLYYKWRLFSFYFLILLEKIMSHPKFLAFLKTSNSCIEVIIIILSAKSFETTEEANKTPQNSENEVDISNDFQEKLQTDETKNDIQEKEILLISLRLLSKIIEKNNLEYSHKQLQEKILTIKQNIKYDIYAEYLLAFFSHVCLVPELIGNLLLNKTPILIIELSQEILKKKDFLGKSSYFFFIINFFLNLHNNNLPNELQELYKSLELEKYLLNLIYEIIQKNEEPFQIFYAFEALCKILNRAISNQKIGDISIKIYFEDFSAREQQKFMDNVIDAVMNNMKKYPDNETLQIAGIEVFNLITRMNLILNSSLVKLGVTRLIISKLADESTIRSIGFSCLHLLKNIGAFSKEALILMNNQKAATAIMNFLSHQGHNLLITQTATPLLKLLSTVDNLELFEGLDSEIKEMIATIAPNPAFIRSNAIESLELLTNFALIESAFDLIISNNVIEEVLNLITFELSQDESVLLEKGELSNNDRVISSAMGFINLLLNSTKTSISIESKMKIQENLLIIIKKQGYIPNQFKQAIIASNLLSKCKETEEIFISECLKSQFLDKLIDGLDQYKDNSEITQEINGILLDFTRKSSQIAEILSEKDFLKILLKETKILFKNFLNNENSEILDRLKGNLDCLKIFSLLGELTTKRLHEINCPELCYNMFHKGIEKKEEEAKAFQIQKCYSKKVRLLFYENEEISGSLVVLFPEILGLLITLTIFNDKSFEFTKEILGDLLKTIELCYKNKGILLLALELLIKLIKTDLKKNLESNCLELFSIPLNYYPLDEEVLIMIGNLFFIINPQLVQEKLNAYQLKPNFDDETTLQLANSLVIYMNRDRKIVETEEQISKNKEIISVFEENMPKNFESFCICVLFFNRMCFHNDLFIEILLKSKVPLQIIETNLEISKINPEVLEISLYTLNKIFKIPSKLSQKIDKLTLDYEEMKTSSIMTQTLSDIYMENKGRHLKDLVVWIEKKEEGYISINHLAIELLFNCTYLYPAIAAYLDENYNLSKIQELYEDICKRNKNLTSNSLVMKLCKLICAMTHIHSCFEGVLKQTSFLQILIDSIQNLQVSETISKEDCRFLEEFLWCLGCFTDNNFDKAEIIEKKVIGVLFQKLNSFGNISFGKIYCIDHIGTALVQTLKTLKILVKNPAIIRITCSDDKSIKILQDSLNNMRENESGSENYDFQGVLEELKIDSIESSENLNEKIIENMMNLLLELTINPLILENFDFLEGVILNHIMFLIKKYKSNLIIAVRGVKFIENSIKSLIEKEILKNKLEHPKIKEIQEFIGKVEVYFHKVSIIKTIAESIKILLSGKVERKLADSIDFEISKTLGENKSIDQEIEENAGRRKRSSAITNTTEILTKLGYVSNSFDYFTQKVEQSCQTSGDTIQAGKLLATIGKFAGNFDKRMKLFNMGVVDSILSMCAHKQIEDSIKLGGYDVLYKIFFEKKILSNYMMSTKLIETIKNDLIVINKQVFPEISLLKRNILKILLKILEQLSENPSILEKLFQENILETIIDILLSSKDKIDIVISICEALGSMAKKPHIIKQMLEFGCLELLMEFYDKYLSNLVALRALALLVGEMASNSIEAQEKLGCMAFPYLIIEGINLYRHDLALANSSFLSLSCLCYNNNKIGDFIVKSEIIKPIALNFVKNSLQNSELMGNIGLLFSNLCYKNHSNKKALGSFGCIQSLMNILEFYTKKDNLNEKTLKNCLKALGNLSLLIENSSLLVKNDFLKIAEEFILGNNNLSELVKIFLDILSNLVSFPEEINYINLMELIDQGIIMLLIKCINQNELNTVVMISTIKALDFLCSNKGVEQYAMNDLVYFTLFKILKSQDWNADLVIKNLRILNHIISSEYIDIYFEGKLPFTLVDIIKVQSHSSEILIKSFKLFGKLCIDKPKAKVIFQTGVIPFAFSISEQIQFPKECIFQIFKLFSSLAKFSDQASEQICQRGCTYIRSIVQENFDDVQIIEISTLLMQNISDINSNADILLQNGCIELSLDILKKFSKNESIIIYMFKFLQNISETNEDYRKNCLIKNCANIIQEIIDINDTKENVKIAGVKSKASIELENQEKLPEADEILGMIFKFKLGQRKSPIRTDIKNFLLAGRICKLYKSNGDYKNMHIFCNPDFKAVFAKRPLKKGEKKYLYRISIENIKETIFDFSNKELLAKSVFAKSGGLFRKKADPELCIALLGDFQKKSEEKSFFIETPNLIEKQRWIEAFLAIIKEFKK